MLAALIFDSALLASILEAVERRGKAIRYHSSLSCERELDRGIERLIVNVRTIDRLQLRLTVWADGPFSFGVHKPGPSRQGGWEMSEVVEGTVHEWTPPQIVARVEESMLRPTDVASIWRDERI